MKYCFVRNALVVQLCLAVQLFVAVLNDLFFNRMDIEKHVQH